MILSPLTLTDPKSSDIWEIANTPLLWACALGVFAVIILQTVLYVRAARGAAPGIEMPMSEVRSSFRAGAVASIGPSLAVVIVAISLLALFGTPAVLLRIGLVGSAGAETASAGIASTTMGAELGGSGYTQQVFAVAFTAMSLSGAMWMLSALILIPILKRGKKTLATRNPAIMALLPTAALLGAFSMLTIAELPKSAVHVVAVVISAGVMGICLFIAKRFDLRWLREWSLGIAILVTLTSVYFIHTGS
ncbi:DUF5058 family protein [Leucobacter insecticola]|uniref:DUF5058 family protein n=1 Tax=Leucobacter insecticola TaxID=2714934 RepID=UPI001FCA5FAE|nr:DUF5058 family protein [Leucobacter insecticola]